SDEVELAVDDANTWRTGGRHGGSFSGPRIRHWVVGIDRTVRPPSPIHNPIRRSASPARSKWRHRRLGSPSIRRRIVGVYCALIPAADNVNDPVNNVCGRLIDSG